MDGTQELLKENERLRNLAEERQQYILKLEKICSELQERVYQLEHAN